VFTIHLGSLGCVSEFSEVRAQVDLGLTTVDRLTGYLGLIENLGRHSDRLGRLGNLLEGHQEVVWKVFRRSVWPTDRSAGLLVGRTHLSGTAVSLVGGDPGVLMSHRTPL
jgi:hypothetical protein